MNTFGKICFWAKNFIFPQSCALCGKSLINADEMRYGLCGSCQSSFACIPGPYCGFCGKPLVSELDLCLPCRNEKERSYNRLWTLFPYTGKYRKLLGAYKFRKNPGLADFLAEKIPPVINANCELKDAVIVPVPPRPGKIKQTGWDQVDYLIKKLVKTDRGLTVSRCLKRRKSRAQKQLDRTDRIINMKGRIFIKGKAPETAVIIDDVITTGSTMEACASVLKEAGTRNVFGLCLFYN
ncbi:MAG: ComF family protein [Treponema sp.]|jgi:ComF family protein|nr:ComF family protein [Treponema sp.]